MSKPVVKVVSVRHVWCIKTARLIRDAAEKDIKGESWSSIGGQKQWNSLRGAKSSITQEWNRYGHAYPVSTEFTIVRDICVYMDKVQTVFYVCCNY
jgi:hypothetical protein